MKAVFYICFSLLSIGMLAQDYSSTLAHKDVMYADSIIHNMRQMENDSLKTVLNEQVEQIMLDVFANEEAFELDMQSGKSMTSLVSDDKKLRIITWNYYDSDIHYYYSGLLLYRDRGQYYYYLLNDKTESDTARNRAYLSHEEWYGAHYYEIVQKKNLDKTIYTLIAWDGYSALTDRKIVEAVYIDSYGMPVFGDALFYKDNSLRQRLVFEYSSQAVMLLRYNPKSDIIVMDNLSPGSNFYEGVYQFYGPDYSYNALQFEKGRWVFHKFINPEIAIEFKRNRKIERIKQGNVSRKF